MGHRADYSQPTDRRSATGPDPVSIAAVPLDAAEEVDDGAQVRQVSARGGTGQRLDRFLASTLTGISRTRIQRWIALGAVRVDGEQVLPRRALSGLEIIEVVALPTEAEQAFEPDAVPLQVVYEDDDLMILDKPPGLVVHPAPGHWRGTLMNGLLHARPDSSRLPRAGIVHRLDKDTSGLLMVARSERAFERLTALIAARAVHRHYLAVVHGETPERFSVDAPIGRDPRDRLRMAVVPAGRGKAARTHCLRLAKTAGHALLRCELETGRTHQIRVHLSHCGHPLVGDTLYAGKPVKGFARQALHAWRLALSHPVSGAALSFDSPPPADLCALAADLSLPDLLTLTATT